MTFKAIAKQILRHTIFSPVHIGAYIRELYFWQNVRHLPVSSFKTVLDAGCGTGEYVIKMAERFPWLEVIGIDIVQGWSQGNFSPNASFKYRDIRGIEDKEAYDFIYCIDVIEYIPDNRQVINKFSQAIRHNGYLYIHIPYNVGRHVLPKRLFIQQDARITKNHRGEQYSLDEMQSILSGIGFEVKSAEYTFGPIGILAWELDRLTDKNLMLKVSLMPFLRTLAQIAVKNRYSKTGSFLILAKKR